MALQTYKVTDTEEHYEMITASEFRVDETWAVFVDGQGEKVRVRSSTIRRIDRVDEPQA